MIDIHCHILPALDDGSADLAESLSMAQIAVTSGVTAIIATPHFRGEEESLSQLGKLVSRFERMRQALDRRKIPLTLYPGAEVLCLPPTPRLAKQRMLPTLGDTDYLLAEFFFDETPEYMNEQLAALQNCGYRPVVAHPERYEAIQKDPALAESWFRAGYVLQLNKGSLLGAFGPKIQQAATRLLNAGFVHLIASDAHSISHRTTDMRPLRQWLSRECPEEYIRILLDENPQRLIRGEDMVSCD